MSDFSTLDLDGGLRLDSRRAVWMTGSRTLIVSDLHIGFPWVQKERGEWMHQEDPDEPRRRLATLASEYQPSEIVFLGDLVHKLVDLVAIENELRALLEPLSNHCRLVLVRGNHDAGFVSRQETWALPITVVDERVVDGRILRHGHLPIAEEVDAAATEQMPMILGHEHPAVHVRDGMTSAKHHCFLVGRDCVVLPAFSGWVTGMLVGTDTFLSPLLSSPRFDRAIPIIGTALLDLPWDQAIVRRA